MGDVHALVRSLRDFSRNDEVIKAVREELRRPVDPVRKRIKATAIATLPHTGGLGAWVAGTKITASVTFTARAVTIRLRGGRRSAGGQSDVRSIDRGRTRHPTFGRRGRGHWFVTTVTPGFFTRTAEEAPEWEAAIDRGIAIALRKIHA